MDENHPRCGAATSAGTVRSLNEDQLLARPPMFVVADGMGGHAAGEVASAIAVESLARFAGRGDLRREDLIAAVADVNDCILSAVAADQAKDGMGTTLSGVVLGTMGGVPHWIVVNVGDSRTYRLERSGLLRQVTVDHSEVEELVAAGHISATEARAHPGRNIVTRSLGTDPAPSPDVWVLPVEPHDCYLVCSDGLTTELDDDEIAREIGRHEDPQQAAEALVAAAVTAGGRDNVTVVIVCWDGPALTWTDPHTDDTAPRLLRLAADGESAR